MKRRILKLMAVLAFGITMLGCSKEEIDKGAPKLPSFKTKIGFRLVPTVNGVTLNTKDSIIYENLAGNIYSVNTFKILFSDIRINDYYYTNYQIGEYHLFDAQDPSTMTFIVEDSIDEFDISSISLFIGFLDEQNVTGKYSDLSNPPANWNWNPLYGGGYRTMLLNGRYLSNSGDVIPDPYEISIGGKRLVITPSDSSFQPNEIIASIPKSEIDIVESGSIPNWDLKEILIEIKVDINHLFQTTGGTSNFNFDAYPSGLETSSTGSKIISDNMLNVWDIGNVYFNQGFDPVE